MEVDPQLLGRFVSLPTMGPGKVVAVEPNRYKVEYFCSPWKKQSRWQAAQTVKAFDLPLRTRVYVLLEDGWKAGEIKGVHRAKGKGSGNEYDIYFSHRPQMRLHERDVFCRCWAEHDDPTLSLATRGVENQYWHERRHRFIASLLEQRAAAGGVGSLLSSAIRFVPHQIEVTRRVLEDPLQRYLLADEVGMGKTIEAGLIIRQFLLSSTGDQVVWIISPQNLAVQWQNEMRTKFRTDEFPNRVRYFSASDFGELPEESPALLVVDEAHHFVINRAHPDLQRVAESAPRLLLLSATPALGQTDILLRLLRLIDPDCYAELSEENFKRQIDQRDTIGYFLRGLRGDASSVLLKQRLRQLPSLFANDSEALHLGHQIAESIEAENVAETRRAINQLRSHVADVHRINQRLIRTRRRDAVGWAFRRRGPEPEDGNPPDLTHVHCIRIEDSRFQNTFDLFEQWRSEVAAAIDQGSQDSRRFVSSIRALFEAFAVSIDAFARVVSTLPDEVMSQSWKTEFQTVFDSENTAEDRWTQLTTALDEFFHRVGTIAHTSKPRIAIFSSDPDDIRRCTAALAGRMGAERAISAASLPIGSDIANLFGPDSNVNFLFCGPAEEEGLNLHFMDAIVHLDLPLSPARLEQRIGRLDRFGRRSEHLVQQVILPGLAPDLSCWHAWYEVLAHSFCIFNQPITDVQFSLEEVIADLTQTLLMAGTLGLYDAVGRVKQKLRDERDRLDNQYALDKVLMEQQGQVDACAALVRVDDKYNDIRDATVDWMNKCLGFLLSGDATKTFELVWEEQSIQLPRWPWARHFARNFNAKLTFNRYFAMREGIKVPPQILRFGSQLIRQLEVQCRWEDRGTAFATWRHLPEIEDDLWLGYKLCYVVEARLPAGVLQAERQSLRARMDAYLAPWLQTFYVDAELQIVTDPRRLRMLEQPYQEGTDMNLARRPQLFDHLMGKTQFEELCRQVRAHSEGWLRNNATFQSAIESAVEKGRLDIRRRISRLNQRRAHREAQCEQVESGLVREIELNEMLLGALPNPEVKLDAMGLIALSRLSPTQFTASS